MYETKSVDFASLRFNFIQMKYMINNLYLTCNFNVLFGLFNGTSGKVVDIIYQTGQKPPDYSPAVVMVHFHSYTGPPFTVTIVSVSRKIDCRCHICFRKQIALRFGRATTIHRCQGMTIGEGEACRYIVIHPGTRAFESRNPGAMYVALSRAKCRGIGGRDPDFTWYESVIVNEDRLCHKVYALINKARNEHMKLLESFAVYTHKKFSHLLRKNDLFFQALKLNRNCVTED